MKYFSTFSGAGGFDLGIDGQCVGFSEIDKYASAVLKYHYPETINYGDIKKINWSTVPDFDLLIGGSPCQDLSVAGKRKGLTGERSGLFAEFIRALQEKKPKYFIWENVKGALSSNQGWDFAEVQAEMEQAGYSLWWQVLNAKDFGVPQNRERIFVIGTRGERGREILFERESSSEDSNSRIVGGTITTRYSTSQWEGTYIETYGNGTRATGKVKQLIGGSQGNRVYDPSGVAVTIASNAGGLGAKTGLYAGGTRIRRLTPTECERLMSWSDFHTKWGVVTDELIRYNTSSNKLELCQSKIKKLGAKWKIVKENKKPTSVIVSCTIKDGSETEARNYQNESTNEIRHVNIVIERSERSEHWECATSITKYFASTATHFTSRRNVQNQVATDTSETETEKTHIDGSWKKVSEGNYDLMKSSITLTAINSIIESLTSTFVHAKSMRVSIKSLPDLSTKESRWEVLSLEMDTIKEMSDSARYKMCGNGVVSNVVTETAKNLLY